jgi:hypothetical protein
MGQRGVSHSRACGTNAALNMYMFEFIYFLLPAHSQEKAAPKTPGFGLVLALD